MAADAKSEKRAVDTCPKFANLRKKLETSRDLAPRPYELGPKFQNVVNRLGYMSLEPKFQVPVSKDGRAVRRRKMITPRLNFFMTNLARDFGALFGPFFAIFSQNDPVNPDLGLFPTCLSHTGHFGVLRSPVALAQSENEC